MDAGNVIAICGLAFTACCALIALLAWAVRILMAIQTELARLGSDTRHAFKRIDRIEQRVFDRGDDE